VPFKGLAVDVGSDAQYLDDAGVIWEADQEYAPGGWGYVGGRGVKTARNIPGTTDDHLYQFSREGMGAYRFDVPDGDYRVELLFAEPQYDAAGKRVFDVRLNGQAVVGRLDLVKDYGAGRPARLSFHTRATGGEGIKVEFGAVVGSPLVSAIRVSRE
jgi:beta-galactosidase